MQAGLQRVALQLQLHLGLAQPGRRAHGCIRLGTARPSALTTAAHRGSARSTAREQAQLATRTAQAGTRLHRAAGVGIHLPGTFEHHIGGQAQAFQAFFCAAGRGAVQCIHPGQWQLAQRTACAQAHRASLRRLAPLRGFPLQLRPPRQRAADVQLARL